MEMTYDGAMVMPANFVVVDEEEMEYLDGGWSFGLLCQNVVNAAGMVTVVKAIASRITYDGLSIWGWMCAGAKGCAWVAKDVASRMLGTFIAQTGVKMATINWVAGQS